MSQEREPLKLAKAVENVLEECRTVVPGIQGLFGFQLIAVFNETFEARLSQAERVTHLVAISLVVLSLVCIMTPAAYHRMTGPREATSRFLTVSTRLLLLSMATLGGAIVLDAFLVARLIVGPTWASLIGGLLLAVFVGLWYAFPYAAVVRERRERLRSMAVPRASP